MSQAGFYLV